jgi:glycosyltransferase involved in cell wall biosynthesis
MNNFRSNRPLRILHIILAIKPPNGQYNEHCLPMLHKRDITICTYFKSIWGITPPTGITLFDGDNSLKGFFRALRAALKEKEYDVIHVHTPHAGVLLPMTLFLSGLYRKIKPSTVHTIQNSFQNFRLLHKLMFIPGFIFNQGLVFCSHACYESFPGFYKWLAGNKVHIVQNAVDLDRIDRTTKAISVVHDDHFTVVTVGLIKIKNAVTVLEASFKYTHPDTRLVVLGEGNMRPLLTQKIEELGLSQQVQLKGMVARDKVFEYFTLADLFVSASWGEGLPVAVMEAMACGRPVVLSDIPPHREIAEGVDFIPLVSADDVEGFAREINKFKEMSVSERTMIGQKCRKLIEERFSLPAMHTGYEKVYATITGNQAAFLLEMSG